MPAAVSIAGRTLGAGHPAFIIAELAWAHDGSIDKAIRIAEGAATAGADAFSIHVTSLGDYMVRQYGNAGTVSAGKPADAIFAYLEQINLPPDQVRRLVRAVRQRRMAACLMPNDHPSLALCRELGPDAFVLSPASFVEDDFVDAVGASGVPVILRIGGATLEEIDATVGRLRRAGARDLLLLHGFQTYPTRLEETNLRVLTVLGQMFDCPTGLADHLDGGDPLAITIPALAIAVGAVALEKHITWDRAERGEDFESALNPEQFAAFVRYVRQAETALGAAAMPEFSADVVRYRNVVRKRVVAAADLQGGTILEPHHLACKRSDEGFEPPARETLVGRRLRSAITCDTPITASLLE
jgi:sialic acid synthase SpsE